MDDLIAAKWPPGYDEAVQLLCDRRALGAREGRVAEVDGRIQTLRDEHKRKSSFLQRLERARLA